MRKIFYYIIDVENYWMFILRKIVSFFGNARLMQYVWRYICRIHSVCRWQCVPLLPLLLKANPFQSSLDRNTWSQDFAFCPALCTTVLRNIGFIFQNIIFSTEWFSFFKCTDCIVKRQDMWSINKCISYSEITFQQKFFSKISSYYLYEYQINLYKDLINLIDIWE